MGGEIDREEGKFNILRGDGELYTQNTEQKIDLHFKRCENKNLTRLRNARPPSYSSSLWALRVFVDVLYCK